MKLKVTFLMLIFSLVFTNSDLIAQRTNIITLEVDTDKVTQDNIEETCTFGEPASISIKDFTYDVQRSDVIIWQGKPAVEGSGLVRITEFKHNSGVELLGKRRIRDTDNTGVVVGRVVEGQPGDEEVYFIKFEVRKRVSQDWNEYIIDPKLKLMPQE